MWTSQVLHAHRHSGELQSCKKTEFLTVIRQYITCRVSQQHVHAALPANDRTAREFFTRDDQSWAARRWGWCSNWA